MITKVFEILDRATYIPVLAIEMYSDVPEERRHLRRTGYGFEGPLIMVVRLVDCRAQYNEFSWAEGSRTMQTAHSYIQAHFNELPSGSVIDCEYISGETPEPKKSDCF